MYEIFLWPESWRGSFYMYLLSFPRFWTLSIGRFWFLFWSILNDVTLKTSNTRLNDRVTGLLVVISWRLKYICIEKINKKETVSDGTMGGARGARPPYLPNWGPKGRTKFFLRAGIPFISGPGWPPPPLSECLDPPLHIVKPKLE